MDATVLTQAIHKSLVVKQKEESQKGWQVWILCLFPKGSCTGVLVPNGMEPVRGVV